MNPDGGSGAGGVIDGIYSAHQEFKGLNFFNSAFPEWVRTLRMRTQPSRSSRPSTSVTRLDELVVNPPDGSLRSGRPE